jgi:hypothetical protein
MTVFRMRRAVSAASVLILLPWLWHMMMMMMMMMMMTVPGAASASVEGGRPRTSDDDLDGGGMAASFADLDEEAPGDKGRQGSIVPRIGDWEGTIDNILDMSEETGVRQVWDGPPDENIEREDDIKGGRRRRPPPMSNDALRFWNKLRGDHAYYKQFVSSESHRHLHEKCQNQEALCTVWALQQRADGESNNDDSNENDANDETTATAECDRNFRYMKAQCPVACRSCLWLDVQSRCAPDPNATDALKQAGELDRLFERITTDPALVEQFQPQVLSRPPAHGTTEDDESSGGMWLVAFPTFLSEDEADRMARLAEQSGLQPSEGTLETETGEAVTVTSDARTSWNAVRCCCIAKRMAVDHHWGRGMASHQLNLLLVSRN